MPNLLSRPPLLEPRALAEIYVVFENRDYRMSLETLLKLITKAKIGLGNVDDTSDATKPLSTAAVAALNEKADKITTATLEALESVIASLENYVQVDTLHESIAAVLATMEPGLSVDEVNDLIAQAVTPLNDALIQLRGDLEAIDITYGNQLALFNGELQKRITIDQFNTYAQETTASLNGQITALSDNLSGALATLSSSFDTRLEAMGASVNSVDSKLSDINTAIEQLNTGLQTHTHAATAITGLSETVEGLMQTLPVPGCNIDVTGNEW